MTTVCIENQTPFQSKWAQGRRLKLQQQYSVGKQQEAAELDEGNYVIL